MLISTLKVSEELRLFNMHEQQKQQKTPGALGLINQVEPLLMDVLLWIAGL